MSAADRDASGPLPQQTTPRTTTPRSTTPRATTPRATTPRATTPRPVLPKATMPRLTDDPIGHPPSEVSAWNVANALTVFRLVLVPVFLVALFAGDGHELGWRVVAAIVFAVASMTDRIDGEIARRRGIVTDFGKLADPIADKALVGAALIGLSVLSDLPWWVTVVMLGRELGVTLLRFWVLRHGVIAASRGGKVKTFLQGLAIGLFVLLPVGSWIEPIAWAFMVCAIVVALATGVDYVLRAMRLRSESRDPAVQDAPARESAGGV